MFLLTPVWGQDSKPYSREAAEKSFRALVAAKDKDIIDVIKDDVGLVCFADSLPFDEEDRFLTIELNKPGEYWFQEKKPNTDTEEQGSIYDGKSELPVTSPGSLHFRVWLNQDWDNVVDSYLTGKWHSYGHFELINGKSVWKAFGDIPPVFRFAEDKDPISGVTSVSAMEDGSIFYATKKYENKSKGITTYEMNVRLSTGRYKETWTPDKGEGFSSVGNCYRAKEFVRTTTPAKKTR
jgi:hypothetical protein